MQFTDTELDSSIEIGRKISRLELDTEKPVEPEEIRVRRQNFLNNLSRMNDSPFESETRVLGNEKLVEGLKHKVLKYKSISQDQQRRIEILEAENDLYRFVIDTFILNKGKIVSEKPSDSTAKASSTRSVQQKPVEGLQSHHEEMMDALTSYKEEILGLLVRKSASNDATTNDKKQARLEPNQFARRQCHFCS